MLTNNLTRFVKPLILSVLAMMGIAADVYSNEITVAIDLSKTYQTIDNFGASDAWTMDPLIRKWSQEGHEAQIDYLSDLLFDVNKGIGLSAWRFNIGAGSYEQGDDSQIMPEKYYRRAQLLQPYPNAPIDTTKQRGQIKMLHKAVEHGVTDLIAFSNSPPVWVTQNGLAHPLPDSGSTNLKADQVDAFAEFLVDVVHFLRQKEGLPINYLSPVNEPTWEWQDTKQEGNRYNNKELKSVYRAVYQKLQAANLNHKVAIEAGEVVEYKAALSDKNFMRYTNSDSPYNAGMNKAGLGKYRNYIQALLGDEQMRQMIDNKLSLHGYFADAWRNDMGELRDLVWQEMQEVAPGSKVWMSEVCILGDTGNVRTFHGPGWEADDMEFALHMGKMLHRDLTRLNASAWHWWLAVTGYHYKDGLIKVDSELNADTIETSKALWALGHYSRFIRPDYQRVEANGADDLTAVMASAYLSPGKDKLVIVAVNASEKQQTLQFDFSGLPQYLTIIADVYLTSDNHDLAHAGLINLSDAYTQPAGSLLTLVVEIPPNS